MRGAYTGSLSLTFNQYIDVETGKTLHAEPGGEYEIMPASGHEVPEMPVPWFVPAGDDAHLAEPLAGEARPDVTGEPDGETGPWHDPEADPAEG